MSDQPASCVTWCEDHGTVVVVHVDDRYLSSGNCPFCDAAQAIKSRDEARAALRRLKALSDKLSGVSDDQQ